MLLVLDSSSVLLCRLQMEGIYCMNIYI
jgi:hypothetical protein